MVLGRRAWALAVWTVVGFASSVRAFILEAELSGWHISARDTEISLSWGGVVWRSPLLSVFSRSRYSLLSDGSWHHGQSKQVRGKPPTERPWSQCVLNSGAMLAHGVALSGTIVTFENRTERWGVTFTSAASSWEATSGSLNFTLFVGNATHAAVASQPTKCSNLYQGGCYFYSSTDVALRWYLDAENKTERIVGAGEQYSTVDLTGQTFYIWSAEQGVGRGRKPISAAIDLHFPLEAGNKYTTYSAVPAFLSTRGYGVVLENSQLINVDFQGHVASTEVVFENRNGQGDVVVSGHILGAGSVREMLPALTEVSGRMQQLPGWLHEGLIVGVEGGQTIVNNTVNKLLAAGVPVVGIWIQDWCGHIKVLNGIEVWWNWELDEAIYSKAFFRELRGRGIHVNTYINPYMSMLNNSVGKPPSVYLEAKARGYLVKDVDGKDLISLNGPTRNPAATIDFFNAEAWEWWVQKIRCNVMLACDDGVPLVTGWMNDYGEHLPLFASVSSPTPSGTSVKKASDLHNMFSRLSASAARKASEGFADVTFYSRSGDLHSPGSARMFWLGDQITGWDACDGLQSAVIGAMSGGLSGWTMTHVDIGGFTMLNIPVPGLKFVRDKDLLIRWLEVAVFVNVAFRSHPGFAPASSSQLWDDDVLNYTRNLTRLFVGLRPYRQELLDEAASTGTPLVRHGVLIDRHDPTWWEAPKSKNPDFAHCSEGNQVGLNQFFLGDELAIAPVFQNEGKQPVVTIANMYLPAGTWANLWGGKQVQGPKHIDVEAPLGRPAVYYRVGTRWTEFFKSLPSQLYAQSEQTDQAEANTLIL